LSDELVQRLTSEEEYFDQKVYAHEGLPEAVIERYVQGRWPWFYPDYPFGLLRSLVPGRSILEIGCGNGSNAVLLALMGAKRVVGVDISHVAVEAAANRVSQHRLRNCEFITAPLETYLRQSPSGQFDIVCGWAILHHMLPDLEDVLIGWKRVPRPNGTLLFAAEPVNLWPWLRKMRLRVKAIKVEGTPGERPLEDRDLSIISKVFPATKLETFRGLGRAERCWDNFRFKLFLGAIDYSLLRLPGFKGFGSVGVIVCRNGDKSIDDRL